MKNIFLCISMTCSLLVIKIDYAQPTNEQFNHSGIISLKGGWHTADKYLPYPTVSDYNIPGGLNLTLCGEVPLGMGVFLGLMGDVWFGHDEPYDSFRNAYVNRDFYGYTFDPVIRWRFQFKKIIWGISLGIGGTSLKVNYPNYYEKFGLMNITSQLLCDFFVSKEIAISSEISYFGMAKIDVGGGGRRNKIFQFKLGLSYYVDLYKK